MKTKSKSNATKKANGRGARTGPVESPDLLQARAEQKQSAEELATAKAALEQAAREDAQHPVDHIEKITELEVMTFRALDAEIRNLELSARSWDLEMQNAQNDMEKLAAAFRRQQETRQRQIDEARSHVAELKPRYLQVITEIAAKYNMDPNFMAIDPEARTVRDLRGEVAQENSS